MNSGLEKFRELFLTDEAFQAKLKNAAETYTGDQNEEAFFTNVLVPLASEYDISVTFDEFKEYIASLSDQELNEDEIAQVAGGGKGVGIGAAACYVIGAGFGGGVGDNEEGSAGCCFVGFGDTYLACGGSGAA